MKKLLLILFIFTIVSYAEPKLLIEAESVELSGKYVVNKNHKNYSGKGFVAGFNSSGTKPLQIKFNLDEAQKDILTFRYAAGFGDTNMNLIINGKKYSKKFYGTKKWSTWSHVTLKAGLKKGLNSISIALNKSDSKPINLDYIAVGKYFKSPFMPQEIELVELGKKTFMAKGCFTCHASAKNDPSIKTGPSLFALYQRKAISRELIDPAEKHKVKVKVDESYIKEAIRRPTALLSIQDKAKGIAFLPIMPAFDKRMLNDLEMASIVAYLQTLNETEKSGPKTVYKHINDFNIQKKGNNETVLVADRPVLRRGAIAQNRKNITSARSYLVGTPSGTHYSFDPNVMGYKLIWTGGFLDRTPELKGRGGFPNKLDRTSALWKMEQPLMQPFLQNGQLFKDDYTTPLNLNKKIISGYNSDTSDYIATADKIPARMTGLINSKKDLPVFSYSIEGNTVSIKLTFDSSNKIIVSVDATLKKPQAFAIPTNFKVVNQSTGNIDKSKWTLPAGRHKATLTLDFESKPQAPKKTEQKENWTPQSLVWKQDSATLPEGYKIENSLAPTDLMGRKILFEPLGIAFKDENTAFVSTRTAGVWKIENNKWQKYSEGFFDSLGLVLEEDGSIVVGDKSGLYKLTDEDKDGWAEKRTIINEQFRFTGVYHEYLHGPVKINNDYYFNLNLSYKNGLYEGGMTWMATCGGLRGWTCKVSPDGKLTPFASGMRSTAGISVSPKNQLVVTENQGSFVGSSTMHIVNEGDFTHSPIGLIDEKGKKVGHPDVQFDKVLSRKKPALIIFPHGKTLNSPGSPSWDMSQGSFGPFKGQIFVGDQTKSCIWRVALEDVDGQTQGALLPFAQGMKAGVMRMIQSPDGKSMWLGQTGRGWRSVGGNESALQKISYDGKSIPDMVHSLKATAKGFKVIFTRTQSPSSQFDKLLVQSWYYIDNKNYGSRQHQRLDHKVLKTTLSKDGKTLDIELENFTANNDGKANHSPRVYNLNFKGTTYGAKVNSYYSQTYYTLKSIPQN